ncbi:amino acid ABC transporter substrate-binding protein [Roseateles sp. DAIF2]|uniref:substrate-binding periplasmic protein n=1 Tax=Roseateles sp. DAIF2 TaxID=2714952 RepID=UPI0018A28C43|nr:ABC transporter substrate-binding protein [Roseateles sp. DAIF2]QPF74775.1 amino acid ABC transporter substrate-binding protein [Roseateles sp. DAIF2]
MPDRRRSLAALMALIAPPIYAQAVVMRASTLLEPDPATTVAERVMREAYRRLGLGLEVQSLPGERSLLSANTGESDAELYRRAGIERAYPNLLMVPVALQTYEIVVFTKSVPAFAVSGWESLRPYRLGFVKGIKIIEEHTVGMRVETVATMLQAFTKLELGRTDLVLANRVSGLATVNAHRFAGVSVLTPPLASFPVFHYLHRRHRGLLARLTEVLRELERERFIASVQEEVLGSY